MSSFMNVIFYCQRLGYVINLICEKTPLILKDYADDSERILTVAELTAANLEDDHCIESMKRLIETGEAQNVGMMFEIRLLLPLDDYKAPFTLTNY